MYEWWSPDLEYFVMGKEEELRFPKLQKLYLELRNLIESCNGVEREICRALQLDLLTSRGALGILRALSGDWAKKVMVLGSEVPQCPDPVSMELDAEFMLVYVSDPVNNPFRGEWAGLGNETVLKRKVKVRKISLSKKYWPTLSLLVSYESDDGRTIEEELTGNPLRRFLLQFQEEVTHLFEKAINSYRDYLERLRRLPTDFGEIRPKGN